jgi:hypothetical protein
MVFILRMHARKTNIIFLFFVAGAEPTLGTPLSPTARQELSG